jgi:membrane-associated phospholipid phosphatase
MTDSSTRPTGARENDERFVGPVDVTAWSTPAGKRVAGRTNGWRTEAPVLEKAMAMRSPAINATAAGIARAFGPVGLPAISLAVAGGLSLRQRSRTPLLLTAIAAAGSLLLTLGGKDVIHRHRPPRRDAIPPYESSPSFPSGHTLNTTTLAGVVAYLLVLQQRRNLPQAATIGAAIATSATVGMSRVLLGAHWFTDVLVGWVSGAGWVSLVITSHRLYLTSSGTERREGERKQAG